MASHINKSRQALHSARILLVGNDPDGACNRAYYAIFDAAMASLLAVSDDNSAIVPKTHRGLIAAFGKQVVLEGYVGQELGAAFNKVERLRLLADYTGDPISAEDADWAVQQAEAFVAAIIAAFNLH
ncbi:MAG: HEPN domain-containing protein [Sphingomonadaceae bacterium]